MAEGHDGGGGGFPTTHQSAIIGLQSPNEADRVSSLAQIVEAYWRPTYTHIRLRWHKAQAEAEEITQDFFLRSVEKSTFATYNPSKGRFRTFLRVCLDNFLVDLDRRGRAKGRDAKLLSFGLDFEALEGELRKYNPSTDDPEKLFHDEWARGLLRTAITKFRAECESKGKNVHFRVFERCTLSSTSAAPSYAEVGAELGLSVIDVTNRLSYTRRKFRAILYEMLREVTGSDEELHEAMRTVVEVKL